MSTRSRRALLAALCLLSLPLMAPTCASPPGGPPWDSIHHRIVTDQSEWNADWAPPVTTGSQTDLLVLLAADLSRSGAEKQESDAAFVLDLSSWPALGPDARYDITLNCAGHEIDWADPSGSGISVLRIRPPSAGTTGVDLGIQDCHITNSGDASGVTGIHVVGDGPTRLVIQDTVARLNLDSGLAVRPELEHLVIDNSIFAGQSVALTDLGGKRKGHRVAVRDSELRGDGDCFQFDFTTTNASIDSGSLLSHGNRFHGCEGIRFSGAHIESLNDSFEAVGSGAQAIFEIGAVEGIASSLELNSATLKSPRLSNATLFRVEDFEFIRSEIQIAGSGPCDSTGLLSPSGRLLDASGDAAPGQIDLVFHTWRHDGRQCAPGDGDPENFLTLAASEMCNGDNANGRCRGRIEVVGLGSWTLDGTTLRMEPGIFNVKGTAATGESGSQFCSVDPPGIVYPGDGVTALSCVSTVDASSGVDHGCASEWDDGVYYDVECGY